MAAFIVSKEGGTPSEEELISFSRERLGLQMPEGIQIIDDIPKGPTGKLLKRELSKRSLKS